MGNRSHIARSRRREGSSRRYPATNLLMRSSRGGKYLGPSGLLLGTWFRDDVRLGTQGLNR